MNNVDDKDFLSNQKPARMAQCLIALAGTFCNFATGCILSYSSPTGTQLQIPVYNITNSTQDCGGELSLALTATQVSWFGSSTNLGAMVGAPIAGVLIKRFGRKTTMLGVVVPFVLGWSLIGKTLFL